MTPSSDQLRVALLTELAAFVNAAGARRVIAPVFRLGFPGGRRGTDQVAVLDEPGFDAGLRADLVERWLEDFVPVAPGRLLLPWITRGGELVPSDVDIAWSSAARAGFARHGLTFPGFIVITRAGWLDLDGVEVTNARVRRRRRPPPP